MARRKDYRDRYCGCLRCFWCGVYHNGNKFHWWTAVVQCIMILLTIATPILPWLQISYSTGNHIERVRQVFDFIDANADNRLDYQELSRAFKEKNYVFFGEHIRTDSEMIAALLADQDSSCLQATLSGLQGQCGVGDRGVCLQPQEWTLYGGRFMDNPQKIQACLVSLIDNGYVQRTGDDCARTQVAEWLAVSTVSPARQCLLSTSLNIYEFSMFARNLVPGLPGTEVALANHCTNTSVDMFLSVYGAMTVYLKLTNAADSTKPRCHTYAGRVEPKNFSCSLILDFWQAKGFDIAPPGAGIDPFSIPDPNPIKCRDMAGWLIDLFDGQKDAFGCNITCSPMGRAQLGAGCVEGAAQRQRENRYVNSPFHPTCKVRNGTGAAEDDCLFDQVCPSCSYPVNKSDFLLDVSGIKSAHSGTSGFSSVYDTMCGLQKMSFVSDLIATVRGERAVKARALAEANVMSSGMLTQCNTKRASGEFADGIIKLQVPTAGMANWPKNQPGLRGGAQYSCDCPLKNTCPKCVEDCMSYGFTYPGPDAAFNTTFDCTGVSQSVISTEGSAAYNESIILNQSIPDRRWECSGAGCDNATGALNREYRFVGSVRDYAAPAPILALMQVFGRLCTVSMAILGLFVGALCMQAYNISLIWKAVRTSDDMSVEDAWDEEKFVMRSCVVTCLIALVPAILYGAYIAQFGQFDKWGATHALSYGWYVSLLLSIVSLFPFYGAWLSYNARPAIWRNALGGFKTTSVVPIGDVEQGLRSGGLPTMQKMGVGKGNSRRGREPPPPPPPRKIVE